MRVVRVSAWLIFPLMVGALWVALTRGFWAHPEIAIVLTLTGAIVAVVPASRRAGTIATFFWAIVASGGPGLQKYIAPLGFAGFGALTVAAAAAYSVRWAQFLLYPLACIEAFIVGSSAHQIAFEMTSVGHLTVHFDSCARAVMPLLFGFLLAVAFIISGPLLLFPVLRGATSYGAQPANPLGTRSGWIWLAAGVAVGVVFGFVAWRDWQIDQPCL